MSLPPKDLLVPGPWRVKGNTVFDANGRTVCVVFARNATAHAYWIAETPKLVPNAEGVVVNETETIANLRQELTKLRSELQDEREDNWEKESEIEDLTEKLDSLRETLKELENKPKA